eukprot:751462-Hanusia_phi.AAC.2
MSRDLKVCSRTLETSKPWTVSSWMHPRKDVGSRDERGRVGEESRSKYRLEEEEVVVVVVVVEGRRPDLVKRSEARVVSGANVGSGQNGRGQGTRAAVVQGYRVCRVPTEMLLPGPLITPLIIFMALIPTRTSSPSFSFAVSEKHAGHLEHGEGGGGMGEDGNEEEDDYGDDNEM